MCLLNATSVSGETEEYRCYVVSVVEVCVPRIRLRVRSEFWRLDFEVGFAFPLARRRGRKTSATGDTQAIPLSILVPG